MKPLSRFLPVLVVGLVSFYLIAAAWPPSDPPGKFHIYEFSKLPVMEDGRVKPLDTVARLALMQISKRQTFSIEPWDPNKAPGASMPAIRWLLDACTKKADKFEVFRIEDDNLLAALGLKRKPGFLRFNLEELKPKFQAIVPIAAKNENRKPADMDAFTRNVVRLVDQVLFYVKLQYLSQPKLLVIPPLAPGEEWRSVREAAETDENNPALAAYSAMLNAYVDDKPTEFNRALADYEALLADKLPDATHKAAFEVFFNNLAPFYHCSVLYGIMLGVTCISWAVYTRPLNRVAFWIGVSTFVLQSFAILTRMYLQDRPPITNLYSTAIFIGWACLLMCLIIEVMFKMTIGNLVAAVIGFVTTFIAHNLATDGDTMHPMRAVLDTNFWLATHVVIINSGYGATFVAGAVGVVFVLAGVFTRALTDDLMKPLTQIIYGTTCFATLLSFTGTVLGGLWGDYSWGRFWGWDPKENGALLIVLWNALVLHARWGGLVKQRGLAVLASFGLIPVAWSWFGVNMLGIGLHSYGLLEDSSGPFWLSTFVLLVLALVAIGCIPIKYWRSFGGPGSGRGPSPKLAMAR